MLENQRLRYLLVRKEGEGDFRRLTLFAPQAGPEGGVNDGFNFRPAGVMRQHLFATLARSQKGAGKGRLGGGSHGAGGAVSRFTRGTTGLGSAHCDQLLRMHVE